MGTKTLPKGKKTIVTQHTPLKTPKRKIAWGRWYELITPFLGIKWGAEITLIGYGWLSGSDGLKVAAGIVTVFLFLEWCQMAWCEFKRRVAQ